jgi:SAM-dependent methyltransferase
MLAYATSGGSGNQHCHANLRLGPRFLPSGRSRRRRCRTHTRVWSRLKCRPLPATRPAQVATHQRIQPLPMAGNGGSGQPQGRGRPGRGRARLFSELAGLACIGPGCVVLEIGCGTGQATVPLAERGCEIMCAELAASLAAAARPQASELPVDARGGGRLRGMAAATRAVRHRSGRYRLPLDQPGRACHEGCMASSSGDTARARSRRT